MIGIAMLLLAQAAPGYSDGPFNLVLRWGQGAPVVVQYENRARCESASLMVLMERDARVDQRTGKAMPVDQSVAGTNAPYAFCIPA